MLRYEVLKPLLIVKFRVITSGCIVDVKVVTHEIYNHLIFQIHVFTLVATNRTSTIRGQSTDRSQLLQADTMNEINFKLNDWSHQTVVEFLTEFKDYIGLISTYQYVTDNGL